MATRVALVARARGRFEAARIAASEDEQIRCDSEADGTVRLENGVRADVRHARVALTPVRPDSTRHYFGRPSMNQSKVEGRIAFIHSAWHSDIVERCRDSFIASIAQHGYTREAIDCIEVPGAFEIPLHAKLVAREGRHAAIV